MKINGRHKGATFAVLGNGPSLTDTPPEVLARAVVIGTNRAFLHCEPDYLVSADGSFADEEKLRINQLRFPVFYPFGAPKGHREVVQYKPFQDLDRQILSDRFEDGLSCVQGTISSAINLAYVMGAARIVFCGWDMNDMSHFYSREGAHVTPHPGLPGVLDFAEKLAEFLCGHDVRAYNANPESAIRSFPFRPLADVLADEEACHA